MWLKRKEKEYPLCPECGARLRVRLGGCPMWFCNNCCYTSEKLKEEETNDNFIRISNHA